VDQLRGDLAPRHFDRFGDERRVGMHDHAQES
jgi:hypothetical protein